MRYILVLACAAQLAATQIARANEALLEPASCAVHQTLWVQHYAAQLFLAPGKPPTALADPRQPKLLRIRIINPALLPPQIPAQWRHALAPVLGVEMMARLQAVYEGLRPGDVVVVAYEPTSGVSLHANDRLLAHAPGHSAIEALLAAWAQEGLPLTEQLKRATARNPCA
jgi:hypothetical protein